MKAYIPDTVLHKLPDDTIRFPLDSILKSTLIEGELIWVMTDEKRSGMIVEGPPRACMAIIDFIEPYQET